MKFILFFLTLQLTANGALIWSESFEAFDPAIDNLEGQNDSWLTDPIGTDSMAVISTVGFELPLSYGDKSLAIGGIPPVGELNSGIAYLSSPTVASFTPDSELKEAVFSVDLVFNSANLDSLTDSFRVTFLDQGFEELSTILFGPSSTSGMVNVYRSNTINTFNTQTSFSVDTAVTLNLVMNFDLNKWSGTLLEQSSGTLLNLFSNVNMTAGIGEANLGGFDMAWLRGDTEWGGNFMIVDNVSLASQVPEVNSLAWVAGALLMGLFRRLR
jgi:hypothetical protein